MRIFFLSDLHIQDDRDPACNRLANFLRELPKRGDLLIFGGDIFDLFVGNKRAFQQKFEPVISALKAASEGGVEVHYLEGNHDFHLGSAMGAGITLHTDDFGLQVEGRNLWVSHGDLIDKEDRGYRFLRALLRNPLIRILIQIIPGEWIDWIGRRSSHESRKYTDGLRAGNQSRIRALYLDFARAKIKEGNHHVLVGHSHLRDQVPISEEGTKGEYLNLGYSQGSLCFATLAEGQESFEIRNYP